MSLEMHLQISHSLFRKLFDMRYDSNIHCYHYLTAPKLHMITYNLFFGTQFTELLVQIIFDCRNDELQRIIIH